MRKLTTTQKATAAVGIGALGLFGTGVAYAYWTTSGTGTGTGAVAAAAQAITVNQTSVISALAPGSTTQALAGNFTNLNPAAVKISQVNISLADTVWQTGCTAADFTLLQPTAQTGLVPVGTGVGGWSGASIAMNNGASNQDGCKGQSLTFSYTTTTAAGA